jgi:hypothetical protein
MKTWLILSALGICVSRGATPPIPEKAKPALVTQTQVDAWMAKWQKRLGLENWDVKAMMVHPCDLKPETLGNLHWDLEARTATIRVLNSADYDIPATDIPTDMEFTVLHELVHLQLAVLPRDNAYRNVEEQVVNRISDALLQMEKGPNYRMRSTPPTPVLAKNKTATEASRTVTKQP